MAITNGSGVGRKKPTIHTGGKQQQDASLDDDPTQHPSQIVGFTTQAMIIANSTTNPFQMIV